MAGWFSAGAAAADGERRCVRRDGIVTCPTGNGKTAVNVYRAFSTDPNVVPILRPSELLVPPPFTNRLPWSRGYFQTIRNAPLTRWDVLPKHVFFSVSLKCFVDEYGHPVPDPGCPADLYGLHSFRTIDDVVSAALGIPLDGRPSRAPDGECRLEPAMNAQFDLFGLLILLALAAIPILLWRVSSPWGAFFRLSTRIFAALFGAFVLWVTIVNTLFFMGVDH